VMAWVVAHYGHFKCLINQWNNMLLRIARINAAITLMGRVCLCQSVNRVESVYIDAK
jgi:hypothetical protein